MKNAFTRRFTAVAGIVTVFAIIVSAASAGTLPQNATSLPSANPTDITAASGLYFTTQLKPSVYAGTTTTTTHWGPTAFPIGSITSTAPKAGSGYTGQSTITIKATKKGYSIANAMVTASGGNFGSILIRSTALSTNGTTYTIKLVYSNGNLPVLSMKWYTTQPA